MEEEQQFGPKSREQVIDEVLQAAAAVAGEVAFPEGVKLEGSSWGGHYYLELVHTPSFSRTHVEFDAFAEGEHTAESLLAAVAPQIEAWLKGIAEKTETAEA